jgi:hypothetical protein
MSMTVNWLQMPMVICDSSDSEQAKQFYIPIKNNYYLRMKAVIRLKYFLEKYGFHVSSRLADKLGMRVTSVRLFFIYISFVTAGLGFGVYLTLAFWIRLKDLIRAKRTSVFDL